MVLRVRSALFLAILCSVLSVRLCEGGDGGGETSEEEEILREALLLIKLIRKGITSNTLSVADLISKQHRISLSAPSLPNPPQRPLNVPSFNNTVQPVQDVQPQHMTNEFYRRKMFNNKVDNSSYGSKGFYRRKMSIKNPNYGKRSKAKRRPAFYRRQDYEDVFGAHPPDTSTKAPSTKTSITTAIVSTSRTSAPSTDPPSSDAASTPAPAPKSVPQNFNKADNSTNNKTSGTTPSSSGSTKRKIQLSMIKAGGDQNATQNSGNDSKPQVKDIVMSQVASELQNEMKEVPHSDKNLVHQTLSKFTTINRDGKEKKITRLPTLRIHLQSSTRYSIPLPENHALCYTDPENGLCRTPI